MSAPEIRQRGFTLTEMAVVFTIVVLLLSSVTYTLTAQMENRAVADTQRRLQDARELLISYAMVNGRLPCPASTASNGDESPAGTGVCGTNGYSGYLPAKAIGFTPVDLQGYAVDFWGNRIRYAVSINSNMGANPDYTFTTPPSSPSTGIKYNFGGASALVPKDLLVCTSYIGGSITTTAPSCGTGLAATNQDTVVAVVWSQGKNFSRGNFNGFAGQAGVDEAFNNKVDPTTIHGVFIAHEARWEFQTNEFDDLVVWLPVNLLYGRMVAAGVLP